MRHRPGDTARRRQAAYLKGRRDLAEEVLALLSKGRLEAIQERLQVAIREEGGRPSLSRQGGRHAT